MKPMFSTGLASLFVQVLTLLVDSYVLTVPVPSSFFLVKQLLWVEYVVNFIEGIFYVWMILHFTRIKNVTVSRYYDWFITTPIMLTTYSMYLLHMKGTTEDLFSLLEQNKHILLPIILLNWCMLGFGYLSEIGKMNARISTPLGFIPFILMFYLIYENYAKYTSLGIKTFYYFILVWGLYGVAAVMNYTTKNVMYNILDLFSKNFFALLLAYVVIENRL